MSQRGRKNNNYESASGGNVLFTLGLVSVVALLVVGYIMTQGGVKSLAENGLVKIPIMPTATLAAGSVATASSGDSEVLKTKYEKEVQQVRTYYEGQIKQQRETYETQIDELNTQITDLNTRIQLLEVSNKALRAKLK